MHALYESHHAINVFFQGSITGIENTISLVGNLIVHLYRIGAFFILCN